jgi:hypothetical protein
MGMKRGEGEAIDRMRQGERKLQSISLFYLERAMTRDCFVSAGVEQITSCVGEDGRHVRASIVYFQHFYLEKSKAKIELDRNER